MLRIRTTVNNENIFLDLYKNEPVLLSLSFAELQDITKKNSNFSKAFSLPGSKLNNTVFNFFYELNSVPTTFDPNSKFEATLLWDGYEIMVGYIRLNGVTISNGEIIYQVTFYNQVGDLMANIGDKFLYDLDLSCLSHPYSIDVVLESQVDPNLFPLTGTTNYSYQNGKTMWGLYNIGYEYTGSNTTVVNSLVTPLVQFSPTYSATTYNPIPGNFDYSGTPVHDFYFKPSIQIKELYEQIVNQAGYNVQSDFFDTAYFKRYYLPLKFVDETVYSRNAIPACFSYTNPLITGLSTSPTNTDPSSGQICNTLGWSSNYYSFTISSAYTGTYTFKFTYVIQPLSQCDLMVGPNYADFYFYDGVQTVNLYSTQYCDSTPQQISFVQQIKITGNTVLEFYFKGYNVDIQGFSQEIVNGPRFIPNGSNIDYNIEFPPNDYKQLDFITSINKMFNLIVVPNPDKPDTLIIEPIVDYVGKGEILDWTTKVDFNQNQSLYPTSSLLNGTLEYEYKLDQDYANQDFKGQTNRIFGTDKFLLGQQYKDQTTKFDFIFGSPIDITVNNSVVSLLTLNSMSKLKQIDVSGATQQTFVPFKILPKTVFRGVTLPNDNYGYLANGTVITSSTFCTSGITVNVTKTGYIKYNDCAGNTIYWRLNSLGTDSWNGCLNPSTVLPGYPLMDIANFTITSSGTPCTNVVNQSSYQQWYLNGGAQDRFQNINRFTTYPFNYNNFSHYINYRGEDQSNITPQEYVFDSEDLYNIYYQPYVNDIISEENKIYSAKVYLYPQDIQKLRWNEKIVINNTRFRINKITNFNALEPSLCDVEFVKLTKDYTPHRRLYYELIPCAGGPSKYSHSDLMYNLYAYAGNYVKLFDESLSYLGCYGVSIDTYDPLHTYEHYWLSSGYTPNLVGVYPDCGCTGRTSFNIVQQSACTTNYFWYTGTSCTDSSTYVFKSEDSNLSSGTTVYKIHNSGFTQNECVYNVGSYFVQNTDWIQVSSAYTDCYTCNLIPPSPTPTKTQTPTPTSTPVIPQYPCSCYQITITSEGGPESYAGAVEFNNCFDNLPNGRVFSVPGIYYQCAYTGTISLTFGTGTIVELSSYCTSGCPPPSTPTPTPSITASPTKTPTITTTQTQTPTPSVTIGITPSSTPPPTSTPTPSVTPNPGYDIYLADEYSCFPCTSTGNSVYVALPSGTTPNYGKYYTPSFIDGFVYNIVTPATGGPAIILTGYNTTNCNLACSI